MSIKSTRKAIATPGAPRGSSGGRAPLRGSQGSSPIRHRAHQDAPAGRYATRVRQVLQYQDGRLESLLLPMLVTSAVVRRSVVQQQQEQLAGFDDVPVVIDVEGDGDGYQEYAASSEEDEGGPNGREGGFRQQLKKQQQLKKPDHAGAFIETLLHALDCKTCDDNGCRKMRLVLGHFLTCRKLRSPGQESCALCQQLIAIVTKHSECCDAKTGCPVPMCDVLKQAGPPPPVDVALKREAPAQLGKNPARVLLAGSVAGFI